MLFTTVQRLQMKRLRAFEFYVRLVAVAIGADAAGDFQAQGLILRPGHFQEGQNITSANP